MFANDIYQNLAKQHASTHIILTKGDILVTSVPYRQSPPVRVNQIIWHHLRIYLTISQPSRKRNNEYRFSVDFQAINRIMQPMSFTIPHMSHIPDTSANAKSEIYLTLDLPSGFIQVALDHATNQCTFSSPAREGMNLIDWPLE